MPAYSGVMRLYLIRHGRTPSNVALLLDTAFPGADLDDVGRAQAERLVTTLADAPLEAVFASDLVRTQQTAAPLAAARGLSVEVLPGLREIQAGSEEMSPDWEAYVGVLKAWAAGDVAAHNPGGETAVGFFERFDAAVADAAARGHAAVALVSHGAALRTWIGHRVRGFTASQAAQRHLGNTAVVVVDSDGEGGWTFVAWHDGEEVHR